MFYILSRYHLVLCLPCSTTEGCAHSSNTSNGDHPESAHLTSARHNMMFKQVQCNVLQACAMQLFLRNHSKPEHHHKIRQSLFLSASNAPKYGHIFNDVFLNKSCPSSSVSHFPQSVTQRDVLNNPKIIPYKPIHIHTATTTARDILNIIPFGIRGFDTFKNIFLHVTNKFEQTNHKGNKIFVKKKVRGNGVLDF